MGANLHLWLRYTLSTDELLFATDMKDEAAVSLIESFLAGERGQGADPMKAAESDVYNIRLRIDLEDDTIYTDHDCGNLGLRDGILAKALLKFEDKSARRVAAAELAPKEKGVGR